MPDHLLLTGIIWFQQSFRFSSSLFLPQTELRGSCICNVVLNFVLEEMPRRECAFGWGSAGSTGIDLLWYSLFPPGQKFDLVCTCHFGLLSVKVNTLTANIGSSFAFLFCCHVRHSESPTWVPRPVTSERVPPIDEGSGSSRWCVCDIRLGCHSIFALGVKFWWRFDFGLTGFQQIVWCVLIWIQIQWTVQAPWLYPSESTRFERNIRIYKWSQVMGKKENHGQSLKTFRLGVLTFWAQKSCLPKNTLLLPSSADFPGNKRVSDLEILIMLSDQ